jgi:hypothetical protein
MSDIESSVENVVLVVGPTGIKDSSAEPTAVKPLDGVTDSRYI